MDSKIREQFVADFIMTRLKAMDITLPQARQETYLYNAVQQAIRTMRDIEEKI